jgi:hypothetical protein
LALCALVVSTPAHAQGLEAARAFTRKLYAAYQAGNPDYAGRDAAATFAPPLLALIRRDQATTPSGDVGILDGDPICDCQDTGGMRMTHLGVKEAGPNAARAEVTLRFPGETRSLTLDLQAVRGHWRVADVHSLATPSLARLLADGLRERAPQRR